MTRKTARTIPRRGGVWLVLCRDLSDVVRIGGETHVRAGMVLDMDTGLVRGAAAAATEFQAVAQAIEMGLTKPGKGLVPGQPDEVLCALELEALLIDVVSSLIGGGRLPAIRVIEQSAEAEDIFDSFVGHLSGRSQPMALPSPSDLEVLYGRAFEFYCAAPWTRWDDGMVMALETSIEDTDGGWAVVVMGNAGIQRGLMLHPAGHIPTGLDGWEPGLSVAMPSGTLSLLLDPPADLPSDLRDKAIRYGWPADADLMPVVLRFGKEGGGDPGERDAELLAVALAAVATHDARGLVAVGTARQVTKGEIVLGNGRTARFSISQEPPARVSDVPSLRVHEVGFDLIPPGTPVVLGHLPWASVTELRAAARIHRPCPPGAPRPAGTEVPLLAILPKPKKGEFIAARIAELDAYGVTPVRTDEGRETFVLAGANGAQLLMDVPADSPSMSDFRRRMRATKGHHVVMVADEATSRGEGTVYGLFECHQPLPSGPRHSDKRPKPSTGRK